MAQPLPRVLMLIIANDDGGLYSALQESWKRYMNSSPQIDAYFIKGRLEQEEEFILDENTLFIKTREGYDTNDALYVKTLSAFRYFRPSLVKYHFVFRTNLSSFIRFDKYLDFCRDLPRAGLCAASIGIRDGIPFPSGSGFTLSIDLVERLIDEPVNHYVMDDVTIGIAMREWGIKIKDAIKCDMVNGCSIDDCKNMLANADETTFHYRVRTYDHGRLDREKVIHQLLFDRFYPATPPKTTIVTMFFDLSILPDATGGVRNEAFYMKNARGTLQLPAPMIIFCDSNTKGKLEQIRSSLTDAPTVFVEKNITEYDFYKMNVERIRENRRGNPSYANSRNTPSYYITTMFKMLALKIAKDRADFATSHYAWIDMGCRHVIKGPMLKPAIQMCLNPNPKVSVTYISYRSREAMKDMPAFVNGGPCGIAAGVITVEREYMDRFYSAAMSIFHEMLYRGCGHTEETILTYCYDRYPELFTLNYGDYCSLLTNYKGPVADFHAIRYFFIEQAVRAGRRDLALTAAKTVLDSVASRQLILPEADLLYLRGLFNMRLTEYHNIKGHHQFEGCCDEVPAQVSDLKSLVTESVKTVLEIGFNAGHSAEAFLLAHPEVNVVSFDIGWHSYVHTAKEYIDIKYPGRHTLILGDSTITMPKYREDNKEKRFDLLFIDGGHSYDIAKSDLDNCVMMAHKNSIIAMDDTNFTGAGMTVHNIGPSRAWTERLSSSALTQVGDTMYTYARGMCWGKRKEICIDAAIVINLEKRKDRLQEFDNQMMRIGLPYERFNAYETSPGMIGCHLSHLECLKIAKTRGYKNILIFEDDFDFLVTPDEFRAAMTEIPESYDVIMLAYSLEAFEPFSDKFVKVLKASAPSGYIVHSRMFDTLIALYEDAAPKLKETGKHWLYANDAVWHSIQSKHEWYAFKNRLGKQRESYSDNSCMIVKRDC